MIEAIDHVLSFCKYLLGVFMMFAGAQTALMPISAAPNGLGLLYATRPGLVVIGIVFFVLGATLVWSKVTKKRRAIGWSLMGIYLSFLFAALVQITAFGFVPVLEWLPNLIFSFFVGFLYLRWKFRLLYAQP